MSSFWRKADPVLDKEGRIIAGGMWPTQRAAWESEHYVKMFIGGYGCVAGDTLIVTDKGLVRIDSLGHGERVLSWDANASQFRFVPCSGGFQKGVDYLYRVTTQQGVFVAAGHHRVFCATGKYRRVRDLVAGVDLYAAPTSHLPTIEDTYRKASHANGLRCSETNAGFLDRCVSAFRRCGLRLRQITKVCLSSAPLQDGAPVYVPCSCREAPSHRHGHKGQEQARTRQGQQYVRRAKNRSDHLLARLSDDAVGRVDASSFARILQGTRQFLRFLLTYGCRHIKRLSFLGRTLVHAFRLSCSVTTIVKIERLSVKHGYWDMQVPVTNNYVTADGTIHHNSGKSTVLGKRSIASAIFNAPVPVLLVSPSYRMAKRTIIPTITSLLDGRKIQYYYNRADATIRINYRDHTGLIWIGSADTPDSLKGSNVAAVYLDEAFLVDWQAVEIMLSRIRDPNARLRELFMVGTPEGVNNWGYDIVKGDKRNDFDISVHTASTLENKALPKEFVQSLIDAYDERTRQAYVEGKLVNLSTGLIYHGFDRERNVVDRNIDGAEIWLGLDFNYDPFCGVLLQVSPDRKEFHAFAEIELNGADTNEMISEAWRISDHRMMGVYPDPSAMQHRTSAQGGVTDIMMIQEMGRQLRNRPFEIRARRRTPPKRDRYNAVNEMFRHGRYTVSPACKTFIKCLELATYENVGKSTDQFSHFCDAGGYCCELENPVTNKVQQQRKWY